MQGENHTDVVAAVKAECAAAGILPAGAEGAYNIVTNVAWRLRAEGAGLLSKPTGNNFNGVATDIICYPNGHIYDVLGDGGGANNPQWNGPEANDPARYVPAFDPGNLGGGPVDPPVEPGEPGDNEQLDRIEAKLDRLLQMRIAIP